MDRICPKCGNPISQIDIVCPHCGAKLSFAPPSGGSIQPKSNIQQVNQQQTDASQESEPEDKLITLPHIIMLAVVYGIIAFIFW